MPKPTSIHRPVLAALVLGLAMLSPAAASDPTHEAQLRKTGSCPGCDLKSANLSGLVAENGDLTNADLAGASLYMATLAGADLTGAALQDADLSGAILTGARGANLAGALTDSRTTCPNGTAGPCQ